MPLIPANAIPAGDWEIGVAVGVPGGIPTTRSNFINVTDAPYNADNTGATDAQPAIQAAIDASIADGSSEGVYCPAGTYRLEAPLTMGVGFSNRSFVGDGSELTIFMDYFGAPFVIGSASGTTDYGESFSDRTITSGNTANSTTIGINGSTTNYPVGRCLVIQFENDDTYPNFNVGASNVWTEQSGVTQAVKISSKGASSFTFSPPLFETRTGTAIVRALTFQADSIGLEGFKIDCSNVSALRSLYLANCWGSWIVDVEITQSNNYGIVMENCVQCELRQVFVHDGKTTGTNGAGLLCGTWSCLVVDSIFVETFPMWEVNGSSGNVFAYNYTGNTSQTNNNHGPFCRFNLYEGNGIGFMISDGYFGGAGPECHYRNFFHSAAVNGINLRRGSRQFALAGNVITIGPIGDDGYPNIGNTSYSGTCQLSLGDPWKDFLMTGQLTLRSGDTIGEITLDSGDLFYSVGTPHNFTIYWGSPPSNFANCVVTSYNSGTHVVGFTASGGTLPVLGTLFQIGAGSFFDGDPATSTFQELDLDVAATTTDKGNFCVNENTFSSLDGDVLVDSLIFPSEPDFVTDAGKPWPTFDSEDPGSVNILNLPAAARFFAGLPPAPPEFVVEVDISGDPIDGNLLTAIDGIADGNPPPDYTYQWRRDGVDIGGATTSTYLLTGADIGTIISVLKTAENTEGSDTSEAFTEEIEPFLGDDLVLNQVTNSSPVTELWLRAPVVDGVAGFFEYYVFAHSGDYPSQPVNGFAYARFGTPQDHVYVFQGTVTEEEAVASVP